MSRPRTGGKSLPQDNSIARSNDAIEFGLFKDVIKSNEQTEEFILDQAYTIKCLQNQSKKPPKRITNLNVDAHLESQLTRLL